MDKSTEQSAAFAAEAQMEFPMSMNSKKSLGWALLLILLGLVALFGGDKWLVVLIPAAIMVWYGAGPTLRRGRN
jgi:hypothetical protein